MALLMTNEVAMYLFCKNLLCLQTSRDKQINLWQSGFYQREQSHKEKHTGGGDAFGGGDAAAQTGAQESILSISCSKNPRLASSKISGIGVLSANLTHCISKFCSY